MKLTQKKFPVTTEFRFDDEVLWHVHSTPQGRTEFSVGYDAISTDESAQVEVKGVWFRNVAVLFALLAAVQALVEFSASGFVDAGVLLVVAAVLAAIARFNTQSYLLIYTNRGTLYLLEDERKDDILIEFEQRRIARLRELYAQVDFSNEFFNELQKFGWLLERGVISQVEYDAAKNQLMFAHSNWVTVDLKRLN